MAAAQAPIPAGSQGSEGILSLVDINYFLVNKLVVLVGVILFFTVVAVVGRIRRRPCPSQVAGTIKLSLLGLLLLYFEATLTDFPNYRLILARLQSVIVLVCLARLVIYLLVDMALALRRHGEVPMLLRDAIRLAVYLVAAIASLRLVFQVDLSAVITTTTVLTAAIAFAMQTTLSNAFHGFSVQIDPLMGRGTWITIPEKNLFGEIVNVGFRYITLRTLDNNQVLVPNSVAVQSIITTHGSSLVPAAERAAQTLTIGLPYELPPEQARSLLLKILRDEPRVLDEPQPVVRLQTLADSSIVYLLKFWIADPVQRGITFDALQTKAWYAVHRAGWGFPFPHRQIVTATPREPFPFSRQELLDGLRQSHLFSALSDGEAQLLADGALLRVFAPGEAAVRQGDEGSSLFFVLSGSLEVLADDRQVALLERGRMFGEMSLLTGEPRRATVRAVSECMLAEVPKQALAELLQRNERLLEQLSEALERHRGGIREHAAQRTEQDSDRRRADYLSVLKSFFGRR
ncbi:mechanosensitive ion channel family protein [Trichlorobacter ammonificans]|uniref:Small-conductance mechanosensitive channel n=1 Tax=Trichlorobacter ammonificans TaxID=2916410 RepID=A0ABM9D9N5_9BACT|nr:mechanosensitive ion channel family protein [Trichlorobacter ammonificans]CAH2031918.1 Small-conductance mechanosensitive channel [Trichlorobacter ammonificans]